MQPGDGSIYKVGHDYTATFEKKNAIGMWSKKHVTLCGLKFSVADSESAAASQSFELTQITQAENNDPLYLTVRGGNEVVQLRGDRQLVDSWYDLGRTALEQAGKIKPRNPGLPPVDPRFGLKFIEIPVEYRYRFASLENAVLYWFGAVKKYGTPSKITGKYGMEERVVIVSDKALYVTKPNSEVTRCMKLQMLKALCTNLTVKKDGEEAFLIIKMEQPDYDLYVGGPDLEQLVKVLRALFHSLSKGRELPLRNVNAPTDAAVDLQLNRPEGFSMSMVVPTTKLPLKKALDVFAEKHGIRLTTTGTAETIRGSPSTTKIVNGGSSANASFASPNKAEKADTLTRFMLAIGLPNTLKSLKKQLVDFEVLRVMEEDDYINFGISKDEARKIKSHIDDDAFMAKIDAGEAPAGSVLSRSSSGSHTLNSPNANTLNSPNTAPKYAPPVQLQKSGGFDDLDDDLDLRVAVKKPGVALASPSQGAAKPPISFDDLDDIMGGFEKSTSFSMKIALDDDDDLDLPPPKPKPKVVVDVDDI
jgi:hypothetical protein